MGSQAPSSYGLEAGWTGALALVALVALYVYLTWNYDFWRKRGVPFMEPVVFFGTIKDMILMRRSEAEVLHDHYRKFPNHKFVGGFQMREPFLLARDLDLIKTILIKDFSSFHDRGVLPVDDERLPLSRNLLSLAGHEWRTLRTKLTPAFSSGKMRLMFPLIDRCGALLCDLLDDPASRGEPVDMREVLNQYTTDVMGSCFLGLQLNALKEPQCEFRQLGNVLTSSSVLDTLRVIFCKQAPSLALALGVTFEGAKATDFFLRTTRDMERQRLQQQQQQQQQQKTTRAAHTDMFGLLLQLKHGGHVDGDTTAPQQHDDKDASFKMTDNMLAAQVFIFFAAGHESSSSSASFAIYEIALHPEVQAQLHAEVDATVARCGGITYDALHDMKYLDKVWNETLRKYPLANTLLRMVTKPYRLPDSDVVLPVGMQVYVPVSSLHHDPLLFPDPSRFDPERFEDDQKGQRHHSAFMPFGDGPRTCIGMRFGILQGKLALAMLLAKYRFEVCARTVTPMRFDPKTFVRKSLDGVWLAVHRRHPTTPSTSA